VAASRLEILYDMSVMAELFIVAQFLGMTWCETKIPGIFGCVQFFPRVYRRIHLSRNSYFCLFYGGRLANCRKFHEEGGQRAFVVHFHVLNIVGYVVSTEMRFREALYSGEIYGSLE